MERVTDLLLSWGLKELTHFSMERYCRFVTKQLQTEMICWNNRSVKVAPQFLLHENDFTVILNISPICNRGFAVISAAYEFETATKLTFSVDIRLRNAFFLRNLMVIVGNYSAFSANYFLRCAARILSAFQSNAGNETNVAM